MSKLAHTIFAGKYQLHQVLGEGATGVVFAAEDANGEKFAVKVIQGQALTLPGIYERFDREAHALSGLRHPNILAVRDFGIDPEKRPYLAMEFLEGESLESMLENGPADPQLAANLTRQILSGLAYAHQAGILHRDIKSANLMCIRDGLSGYRVKLVDFGLVKFVDQEKWGGNASKQLTVSGTVFGSPAYMSPEQARGRPLDARSDVYSTGVVLFELFSARWPFEAETEIDMMMKHFQAPVPLLRDTVPGLETRAEFEAFMQKALAKNPEERFANGVEMLAAFDAIPKPVAQGGAVIRQRPPPQFSVSSDLEATSMPPAKGAPLALYVVGAIVLTAAVAGLTWFVLSRM